jgi:hypothetical protein
MDMLTLVAVCCAAFVMIPKLWWSRELCPETLDTTPAWMGHEKISFARETGVRREAGVHALDRIFPATI